MKSTVKGRYIKSESYEDEVLGRYPFRTWSIRYLNTVGPTYARTTVAELDRRYRRLDRIVRNLYNIGRVKTHDPLKMSAEDILSIVGWLKSTGLREQSICHDITAINNLLSFAGNGAVKTFRVKYRSSVPRNRHIRAPEMDKDTYCKIFQLGESVSSNDWIRLRAYALVELALCAGLRAKELQFATVPNLNLNNWTIYLERVKGEGTYGQARTVPIRPEGRDLILRYVRCRDLEMKKRNKSWNPYLFPTVQGKSDGYLSTNTLRMIKEVVQKEVGSKFDLRMCRRTYGQMAIDEGIRSDNVALLLGHNSTKTTEAFYCRQRPSVAIKEALELWEKN